MSENLRPPETLEELEKVYRPQTFNEYKKECEKPKETEFAALDLTNAILNCRPKRLTDYF